MIIRFFFKKKRIRGPSKSMLKLKDRVKCKGVGRKSMTATKTRSWEYVIPNRSLIYASPELEDHIRIFLLPPVNVQKGRTSSSRFDLLALSYLIINSSGPYIKICWVCSCTRNSLFRIFLDLKIYFGRFYQSFTFNFTCLLSSSMGHISL